MCSCHSIPECCVMFSGVKLSMDGIVCCIYEEPAILKYEEQMKMRHRNFKNSKCGTIINKNILSCMLPLIFCAAVTAVGLAMGK